MADQPKSRTKSAILAVLALLAACAWIATGALYKLLDGTPKDLPGTVLDFAESSGLALNTIYVTAIGIELGIVTFALLKPKLGWLPVVAQYLVFIAILGNEIARGAESCGCVGSNIDVPPVVMLCVDAALLLGLLVTRPWSSLTTKLLLPAPLALIAAVAVAYVPRLDQFDRNLSIEDIQLGDVGHAPAAAGTTGTGNGAANATSNEPDSSAPADPSDGSGYLVLDLGDYLGEDLAKTDLGKLLGAQCPTEGKVVLWRISCDHCAAHLEELQRTEADLMAQGQFPEPLSLVRVPDDDKATPLVELKPEMVLADLTLPRGYEYVVETPSELMLSGGVVTAVDEGLHGEDH